MAVPVGAVLVQPDERDLVIGEAFEFDARVEDEAGRELRGATVTWSSDDPDSLSIDEESGMATALGPGTVTVTATFRGVTGSATVTVEPPPTITVESDSVEFLAFSGGSDPPPVNLRVDNLISGQIDSLEAAVQYPQGQSVDWLDVTLSRAFTPAELTLTADPSAVSPGFHRAMVVVTSARIAAPDTVFVSLSLTGLTVDETNGDTRVIEAGATDTLQISLQAQPDSDVVLDVLTGDPGQVTPTPASLTFTPSNFGTPQVVVLTATDDLVSDGDQVTPVTVRVDDDASDPRYEPVEDVVVNVDVVDDDIPSFSVTETGGGTAVTEAGTTDDFSVVLDVEPLSTVVLDVTTTDATEVVAGPTTLTFTPADWATAQTVTVTGVDDDVLDGAQQVAIVIAVDTATSDDAFDLVAPDSVDVTNSDDDNAGFTVVESPPPSPSPDTTLVTEAGSTDDFTVVLDAQPSSNVTISVVGDDPTEVTVSPPVLVFTPADWSTPQTVTLTGVDDDIIDGDQSTDVTLAVDPSSDDDFDGLPDVVVDVATTDDDQPGFTITESGGATSVTEAGSSDDFTVALTAEPVSDVVLDIASDDSGEVTISTGTLTFSPASWDTPQTVTVTGIDELIDDGDQLTNVRVTVDAAASDDDFDAVPADSVVTTTVDDDTAGFVITQSGGGTLVTEAGSTDDFTVVLTSEPVEDVVMTMTASDATEAEVSPISLTFTPATWNVAQTVTVTGVDDLEDDEDQFSLIAVAVSEALSDAAYDPLPDQTVSVTTTDDDSPAGFTVTAIGGTTVSESGTTDDFTVELDTQPVSDVVFDISSGDPTEASVNVATLTFTSTDWDTPQTVTVTGVDDDLIDGAQVSVVTIAVNDAASDDNFDPLADATLNVTTNDDDVAGFTLTETGGSTLVGEGGSTDTFTAVLDAEPTSNVVLSVTSQDLGEASVSPATLTFTPGNWNTVQTVTVTGEDDLALDGTQTTDVVVAVVDGSSDDAFDAVADQTIDVQTTDNDQPGITLTESGPGTTVTEAGGTDDFSVVLNAQPATDVVLNVVSGDLGEVTVVPTTLTFTSVNWETPQSVVLTGIDDPLIDGDVVTVITVSVDDAASDDAYDPIADETVSATTTDDDGAGFTIVEAAPPTTVAEAGTTGTFTVVLDAQPASAVILDITSGDTGETTVSPASLTFTSGGWDTPQTVTVTGVDDALIDGPQVTLVTVSVDAAASDDAYDLVADQTVSVTTTDDDGASFIVTETGGGTLVSESGGQDVFTVVLGAQPTSNVVLDVASADFGEAVAAPTTLTFTPTDWDTPQTVTVTGVNDPIIDGDQSTTLTIAVDAAASDDDFDALAAQAVSVITTDDDAAGFVVAQSDATTSVTEAASTDDFTVVLASQPAADVILDLTNPDPGEVGLSAASLTFTAADWNTPQTVTVTGVDDFIDDGDVVTTLTISVDGPGSDPAFSGVPSQIVNVTTTDDDVAGFTVAETGGTLVTEAGSTDVFTVVLDTEPVSNVEIDVTSADLGEVTVSPATLTFTPADWDTPQTVTVTGVDDLLDDDAQFTVVTMAIDDAASDPAFAAVLDRTVTVTTTDDDDPVGFTVTAIGGLTVTEAGSTDDFTVVLDAQPGTDVVIDVTSGDPGEVSVSPAALTFTNLNWDTPQTVTVAGVDDDLIDGSQSTDVTLSVNDAASDDAFDALPDQLQSVTTTDDDVAGFTVTESGGGTIVNEGGTTDDVTVVLDAEPTSNVEIDVSSADTDEATVSPATLTFTPASWDTPQTVTVTGVDDTPPVIDGNQTTVVTFAVDAAASDDDFDALPDQTISVTTTDNDAPGVTVTESGGSTEVDESGTTDTFTVVLSSGPATDVVIDVTSSDTGEAGVAPATLTFTSANWFTPQTVTVTGVDDALPDGDQVSTVTIAVNAAASDDAYDPVPDETVSVTTTDDDGAGFTLTETGGGTSVTEAGSTDTFDVVLDAQPTTAVSITLTSGDTGETTVFPSTVTFTNANWDTPQTVTVTGVDDALIDGNQVTLVTVAVDDASSDPAYSGVADQTISVTTLDDDLAGFTIVESGGGTLVNEAGSTDDFTIVLDTEPTSNVVLTVTAGDVGEATSAPVSLTFTPVNWDTPQTVTVTGVDDALIDGSQLSTITISVDDGASDDDYDPLPDETVSVTTNDDDGAGFLIAESGGITSVGEVSGIDDFTVVLTAEPASDVVLDVTSGDPGEATVAPVSLTFTTADWDTPQTVTVTGVDDDIDDGNQTTPVTVSVNDAASDDAFDAVLDQIVSVTTTDDDVAGITTVESGGGTLVTEGGSTDDFTVVLDTEPISNVVIDVTSGDTGEATVTPATLTFTPADWDTPQTVTITGVDDFIDDGNQFTVVSLAVDDAASDDAYDPVLDATVTVTTADDDDPAGFTVTAIGGLSVTEAGSTDDFTVVLDAQPATDVVIDVTSGDTGEALVSPAALTFTNANWNAPQTVTVTGVDDDLIDGSQSTTLTLSVNDGASDDAFDAVPDQTQSVTTTDDDVAGFTVTESGGSTVVNESGTTDDIAVVLDAEPTSNVEIDVSSADTGEASVSPATLVFTPADWDSPQTVTVTGENDLAIDGSQSTLVTFAVDAGASDDDFDALADQTVSVTTTDDDAPGISVTESGGDTEVDESGTTDTFTVVLSSGPTNDVVLDVSSGDTGEATVSPVTLTFTSVNWATPQTVTLTGVEDALPDGDQVTVVTIAVDDAASDDAYDPVPDETVSVTTTDNDGAGFTVTESGGATSVTEAGGTDTFDVVLDAQPATAVSLTIVSADVGEATVSAATLTFTNANWDTPQTVTVTGVNDDLIDGSQTTLVTVAVDDGSSDPAYASVPDQTVSVTTTDDDLAAFTIVESGGGTLVNEAASTDDFTVVLETEPTSDVVLDITASDPGEATATPATLTFTSANWDTPQTVTVTGVDDAVIDGSQLSTITVSVDDAASDDDYDPLADQTVSVTTNDDDGAGFIVTETGGSTFVTEAGGTDDFTVVLTAEPGSDVVFDLTLSDPTEASLSASTLTFTSANWSTPQTVTVTGVDDVVDDGSVVSTITISVDDGASDDAFDPLLDQTVTVTTSDDDTASFTVTESLGDTEVTEAGSTDDFTVVLDTEPESNVVFTVASGDVSETTVSVSTLTFTPANWDTPQTVTVTGVDDPVNDGDQVTPVTISVNDGPSDDAFDPLPDQTVLVRTTDDDLAGFTIAQTGGGTSVNESGTTDEFTVVLTAEPSSNVVLLVSSADPGEVTASPSVLTFTSVNWATPQTVTVTGVDDQFDDGDRFTLVTISVDDASSDDAYDLLADQSVSVTTIDDDGVGFTIVESLSNTTVTEAGSTDDFTVVLDAQPTTDVVLDITSADVGEATVSPASLTFTNGNWDSPQTVTVTGVDDLMDDGDVVTLVTVAVDAAASDDAYDAVAAQNVGVTTTDDDAAGLTVVESGLGTTVDEAGATTDDFTVVLTAQPVSDVVVSVTSGDAGEASVSPTSLTFTTANWNSAQTVTVTGVDDDLADGDQSTNVVVAVVDGLSDDAYDGVPDETVAVTTTDDDIASFAVVESGGATTVTEAGSTDDFTVVLGAQPETNVVLSVVSGDPGEASVSVSNLVFTTSNWDTPQTVVVTGVNDAVDDGDQSTTITIAVVDGASDDAFDALPDQTVSATTTDDDDAGFTFSESGGSTTVSESGTTDQFTVVLTSEPTSNVVITVTAQDLGEATAAPASLTFTPGNWNVPQEVTVTGIDDPLVDGNVSSDVVLAIDDANSDDTYDPLADQAVSVTTTDDDGAGYLVTESGPGTTVTEGGSFDTFDVVLTAQPSSDVVFDVVSADTDEASVAPATLTFTTTDWDTPQTVTVTGVDDVFVDGDQVTLVTVSVDAAASDDDFDALADETVDVTTSDDDVAGMTVTETGGTTTVSESATTDLIDVVLDAAPTSDVVVSASSADTDEVTVSPATLTFTSANWNVTQSFTVTGVDDAVVDGDPSTLVTIAIDDGASNDAFDPLADQTVAVTTTDDDAAGFTIAESDGTTVVTEGASTDDFTVVLDRQPLTNVVFDVSTADPGEVTASPALLTFTPANWDTPQTVTVTGVDDAVEDGDQSTAVTVAVSDANSDDAFDPLADQIVSVTTSDDDTAGFTILESGGTTDVAESGTSDTFTVVLDAQPTSTVELDLSSDDTTESTVSPATLTFTPADWSTPQTVTVTGVDDDVIDGTVGSTITVTVDDANSDDAFDPLADQTVAVTTTDDDVAGFTVEETGGTSVSEAGTTDIFTVVLDAEPASDVVITVVSDDTGEATVAPTPLTFTPANWDTPQTVTVTGEDDVLSDGNQTTNVTVSVDAANSDDDFDLLADQIVVVTTIDDDGAGFTVDETGGNTRVTEGGSTDDFTVVLNTQPASNVVLTVVSADTGEATVSVATLTFTDLNWSTPQTVTVTGVNDLNDDGNQLTSVTISVDDAASDDAYDPVADQIVTVTTVDNDIAGFQIVQSGGGTIVSETGTTDDFTVVLTAQPLTDVELTVTAGDPTEATAAPTPLVFTNTDWDTPQTVTVTGVDDALLDSFQFSSITISVDDANSDDAFDPLQDQIVSVTTTDDDGAGFTVVESGGSTDVDEGGSTDSFTIVLDAQPFGDVVFNVTSGDTGEATVSPATVTFNNGNWDAPQTVTVTGVDDDVIDPGQTSVITIAVNPALSEDGFDAMPNQQVTANVTDDDVAGFTIAETAGFTSVTEAESTDQFTVVLDAEPGSNVVIDVSSPDTGEATVSPASLIFAPGTWDTPQTVTVTGVDDEIDDGDQTTLISVAVNAGSSDDDFDAVASQTVSATTVDDDGAGIVVVESGGGTTVDEPGGSDDFTVVLAAQPLTSVTLNVTSADTDEVTVSPATLTFTALDWDTPQTVTVDAADDDIDDGDQGTTVTISVDVGSSDATYAAVPDETVAVTTTDDDDSGFVVAISGGSTTVTEAGGTDDFTVVLTSEPVVGVTIDVSSTDTGEATVAPATLNFTSANWATPQLVTVTGQNDGSLVDGDITFNVTVAVNDAGSDASYDPLPNQQVSVTNEDNDAAGFALAESGGSTTVSEAGTTDDFTVVLTGQPETNVVFDVSSDDPDEASVSPSTLTFTTGNWDTPQSVTVTGVDDAPLLDEDQTATLRVAIDAIGSNDAFDLLADQTVSATVTDTEVAGFTVSETGGGTTVNESGTTDIINVQLDAQPLSDVTINVSSLDPGEVTVSPSSLTFTSGNWSTAQPVTVTGVSDTPLSDGDQTTDVLFAVDAAGSYDPFDTVGNQTVSVTTVDADVPGFTIVESGGTTSVDESGTTDGFTVELTAQPGSNVVINVSSDDTGEATVNTGTLLFTPSNWDSPQPVTVTGVNEGTPLVDGTQISTVTLTINTGASDPSFGSVADQFVTVTTTDDDVAAFSFTESGGSTVVNEDGSGNTDTFDVILDAQPETNVVIDVSAGSPGEATAAPTTLTFTNANWNSAQTVTVTGADDSPLVDGPQGSNITLAINDGSSDDFWDALGNQTVSVTTNDTDVAGYDVDESGGVTQVNEDGAAPDNTDDFTVVLTAQPEGSVVFNLSSDNTAEATVSPATLTFTNANWATPQTVTVTGVDDQVIDGTGSATITVSVNQPATTPLFDGLADQTVSVANLDDDVAGFTVVETGSTAVTEDPGAGNTDVFTVVLDAEPMSDVVISVTSGNLNEVTAAPTPLTFTTGNWSTPQAVTVTGVDDDIDDDDQITLVTLAIVEGSSDDAFDPLPDQTVSVTTVDDDAVGFTLAGAPVTVDESGTSDTFTAVLDSEPLSNVVLTFTASDGTEASVLPASVTFSPANWDTPRTITVTGVDDDIIDGSVGSTVTVSVNDGLSDDAYDPLPDQTAGVTTTDDDAAGFAIVESGNSTSVTEAGSTDDFTVVLTAQPQSNVVLLVTTADNGEAIVSPTTVTFTTGNWDTPQSVDVAGVDDDVDDGDVVTAITVSVDDANSDNDWDPLADQTVNATTTDDDTAGVTVSTISGNTTETAPGTATFTVVLDSEPTATVTIDLASNDLTEGDVTDPLSGTLTFTTGNWASPQTVTVTGVDDDVDDGDIAYSIVLDPATSADPNYSGLDPDDVAVTNTDDDTAGVTVSTISGNTTEAGPGTATFTVVLDSEPTATVTIDLASNDLTEGDVTDPLSGTLTFTTGNWASPQTVTVTGVDDDVDDGDIAHSIVLDPATSADPNYSGLDPDDVAVTNTDDDTAGVTVSTISGNTTEAGAGTATFTVVLDSEPTATVTIDLASNDLTEGDVTDPLSGTLTFTTGNWNGAQTVTVTGVDDAFADGDIAYSIVLDPATSADPNYSGLDPDDVAVTNTDDETAGFTVTEVGGNTVTDEDGPDQNITVVLTEQPETDVVIDITEDDLDNSELTLSTTQLTFTSANWDTPQSIVVSPLTDGIEDGNQDITITFSVNDASSPAPFGTLADQTVVATINDID